MHIITNNNNINNIYTKNIISFNLKQTFEAGIGIGNFETF